MIVKVQIIFNLSKMFSEKHNLCLVFIENFSRYTICFLKFLLLALSCNFFLLLIFRKFPFLFFKTSVGFFQVCKMSIIFNNVLRVSFHFISMGKFKSTFTGVKAVLSSQCQLIFYIGI